MLQGVPVIVTDYSGSADYATVDCALLVDYDLKLVGESEYPGAQGQRWAEANIASAARHLRWCIRIRARLGPSASGAATGSGAFTAPRRWARHVAGARDCRGPHRG